MCNGLGRIGHPSVPNTRYANKPPRPTGTLLCCAAWSRVSPHQMPHFHALSWTYRVDYESGGHAMASVLDPSGDRTARLMVGYSGLLTALPFVATYAGMLHPYGALAALPANGKLLWDSWRFYDKRSNANAKAAFHTSLWCVAFLWPQGWLEASSHRVQRVSPHTERCVCCDADPLSSAGTFWSSWARSWCGQSAGSRRTRRCVAGVGTTECARPAWFGWFEHAWDWCV